MAARCDHPPATGRLGGDELARVRLVRPPCPLGTHFASFSPRRFFFFSSLPKRTASVWEGVLYAALGMEGSWGEHARCLGKSKIWSKEQREKGKGEC